MIRLFLLLNGELVMFLKTLFLCCACFSFVGVVNAQTLNLRANFLLDQNQKKIPAYDAAMERIGSEFYLIGTGTKGNLWSSDNLTDWQQHAQMLTMKGAPEWTLDPKFNFIKSKGFSTETYPRFGAGGLFHWNGFVFYAFNGVGQSYASIDDVKLGKKNAFYHASTELPHSRGIDPEYYIDRTGQLYYIRKVNALEPNPIEVNQPYEGPAILMAKADSPLQSEAEIKAKGQENLKLAIWGEPGEHFFYDKKNFEGPKAFYARDKNYLFFVGNVMSARIGQYQIGVAIADKVTDFNNRIKLPTPLIGRNFERQLIDWKPIFPTSEHGAGIKQASFKQPKVDDLGVKWTNVNYRLDKDWQALYGGLGFPLQDRRVDIRGLHTNWGNKANTVYMRKLFTLDQLDELAVLRYRYEGKGEIKVNGHTIIDKHNQRMNSYANMTLDKQYLNKGQNVITAEISKKQNGFNFVDFGLYMTEQAIQDDITGFSQPNIFRGLNGFEYWLSGKAFYNGESGQGLERVYFFDDRVEVSPATGTQSKNLPLAHTMPYVLDRFTKASLPAHWQSPTAYQINRAALQLLPNKPLLISQNIAHHAHYYLHVGIRFSEQSPDTAKILVWYQDEQNYLQASLSKQSHELIIERVKYGKKIEVKKVPLPKAFEFMSSESPLTQFENQLHFIEFYKNENEVRVKLNQFWLNQSEPIQFESINSAGTVGLLSASADNEFDDFIFNPGFEDWDQHIKGWHIQDQQTQLQIQPQGMKLMGRALKGDALLSIEANLQATQAELNSQAEFGLNLHYADKSELKIGANLADKLWFARFADSAEPAQVLASASLVHQNYLAFEHSGKTQQEYLYDFSHPVKLNRFNVLWNQDNNRFLNTKFKLPKKGDISAQIWTDDGFKPITLNAQSEAVTGQYQTYQLKSPVITSKLKIISKSENNRPFAFYSEHLAQARNSIRMVRDSGKILVWVNQKLVMNFTDPKPKQKVKLGLFSKESSTYFNDINVFSRGVNNEF